MLLQYLNSLTHALMEQTITDTHLVEHRHPTTQELTFNLLTLLVEHTRASPELVQMGLVALLE